MSPIQHPERAGISQLTIIAEGREPGVFRQIEALQALERFQRYMEHSNPLAGGSASGVDIIRQLYQMEAIMYWSAIDMNINSLPVAAIGIGIGIDYRYYVLSRITEEYEHSLDIDRAIEEALMTTGRAILFTGVTLTTSVIFWPFFPMKFQTEMAFLLTVILFLHVVGALVFIPSMVSLWKPRFATSGVTAWPGGGLH
jgi:hypothetical protein